MAPPYVFRPMTTADLPLVRRWLAEPHVAQWWGDTYEQFELVSGDLESRGHGPVYRGDGRATVRIHPVL